MQRWNHGVSEWQMLTGPDYMALTLNRCNVASGDGDMGSRLLHCFVPMGPWERYLSFILIGSETQF